MESLKIIAQKEPKFYRKLHKIALELFPETSRYYTISPNLSTIQNIDEISDSDLSSLFDDPNLRQILHVSYGEILKSNKLKTKFFEILEENIILYWKALENHIGTHLESLGIL